MKLTVHLCAFEKAGETMIREVDIPDKEANLVIDAPELLELAFKYGQNDFQSLPCRSVSAGDVVVLPDGSMHRVGSCGWIHLPADAKIEGLTGRYW